MNVFKTDKQGKIKYAFFDDESGGVWYDISGEKPVVSKKIVVRAYDGSLHFSDEVTEQELKTIHAEMLLSEKWSDLRAGRNARIAATDYMLLPDVGLSDDKRAKVLAYRQALRDLPAQAGAPWDGGPNVPWPVLEQ